MVTTDLLEELGQALIADRVVSQARLQQYPNLLATMPDRRELLSIPEVLHLIAEIEGRIEGEIEIAPGQRIPARAFVQRMLGMLVSFMVHQFRTAKDALTTGIARGNEMRVYPSLEELCKDITSFRSRLNLALSALEPLVLVQDRFEKLYMIPELSREPLRRAIQDLVALKVVTHPGLKHALEYLEGLA